VFLAEFLGDFDREEEDIAEKGGSSGKNGFLEDIGQYLR